MVFCFVQKFVFGHKSSNIYFFFQILTLGYMTKTLNQIIFFSNIGNQNIFLEKTIPPPFKLNGRSLTETSRLRVHFFLTKVLQTCVVC
jgi:hypothetical protein